ncbi:MAG: hypothetical protein IPK73_20945 [Candidatus Obscuribacter sp.]|nr:hypothetical protein [Candidatus Obscuribacter sp.]MBK9276585.1 hypothetical protein [Candidatus Obscuribacter sp.]
MTDISKEARLRITANRIETALARLEGGGDEILFLNSMLKLGHVFAQTFPTYDEFAKFWTEKNFPERFLQDLKCIWQDPIEIN